MDTFTLLNADGSKLYKRTYMKTTGMTEEEKLQRKRDRALAYYYNVVKPRKEDPNQKPEVNKALVQCCCGRIMQRYAHPRHLKTKIHLMWMNAKKPDPTPTELLVVVEPPVQPPVLVEPSPALNLSE